MTPLGTKAQLLMWERQYLARRTISAEERYSRLRTALDVLVAEMDADINRKRKWRDVDATPYWCYRLEELLRGT